MKLKRSWIMIINIEMESEINEPRMTRVIYKTRSKLRKVMKQNRKKKTKNNENWTATTLSY